MKKMPQDAQRRPAPKNSLAALVYYGVVLIAVLAASAAYSAGASLEGALVRGAVVLLACTVVGCALNIVLALSARTGKPGARLDLVAGDDEAGQPAERRAPAAAEHAARQPVPAAPAVH